MSIVSQKNEQGGGEERGYGLCMHQAVQKRGDNDDDFRVAATEMGEGHHSRDQLLSCNVF